MTVIDTGMGDHRRVAGITGRHRMAVIGMEAAHRRMAAAMGTAVRHRPVVVTGTAGLRRREAGVRTMAGTVRRQADRHRPRAARTGRRIRAIAGGADIAITTTSYP
jgi:hypothetical protein